MTVSELKALYGYNFECNISKTFCEKHNDIWGSAFIWLGENIGVEYNYCIDDDGANCSAIYKMELNICTELMETDYNKFIHYEVDFDDVRWVDNLENAMCMALINFFEIYK